LVFDTDRLEVWLNELAKRNILDKVFILVGVTPLKTLKMANYMQNEVPGVVIPESVIRRMEAAEKGGNASEEGIQIALELIGNIKVKQGVNGIHIMAVGWEEIVPRIVRDSNLLANENIEVN
jgi:methylenetetrahydrofolate reductase (NADPH)